jgi:UDP-N-acetylglucosamine 2-epimerase
MKIINIIGARPQFIKVGVVNKALVENPNFESIIIHTGQHYDENMSKVFFDELEIARPDYNLNVGSGTHGKQTADMLSGIEEVLMNEKPDWVIVYGDTNSTVAGSLASAKLHIKTAHVEAGLRSFNRLMPEEINRIATDHISDLLFAPTKTAMELLKKEGLESKSVFSGDVMYDSILHFERLAQEKVRLNQITELDKYYLATIHRQENTDDLSRLKNIFNAFSELELPIILPVHPRTRKILQNIKLSDNIKIIDPVSYLEMIILLKNCRKVLTDSGGLQKEAFFLKKQCITLRDETEWTETLENNWNFVVGTNPQLILDKLKAEKIEKQNDYFGDGSSVKRILDALLNF